jgi:phospholipid/cholesterol/gamma-HCH transport system substrate-binding protein|tara:strand:+ start:6169 stop:7125 length:957 start_codon:yes stop_codon:yes gene_type:complete
MKRLSKEFLTGFIFILTIILIIYGIKFLKGLNVFESEKTYYSIYDDIDGLQIGSSVNLNGFNIGTVSNIQLISLNNNLLVSLNINKLDSIPSNSVFKIVNQDLMGTKGVSLVFGKSLEFAQVGDTIKSSIENSLQDEVNAQILPLKNKAEELIGSVDSLLTIVSAVLNKNTRENLSNSLKSLDLTFSLMSKTMIKVDSLIYKNDNRLTSILTNIESITSTINSNNSNIKNVMENVSSISDSLAKSDILSLVNNLNEITNNIARGKGSLAKLINDDNFYDNLEKSSKEMNLLIEDIKNNPSRYVNFSILGGSKKSYQKK